MRKVWVAVAVAAGLVPVAAWAQQQQPGDDSHGAGYNDSFDDNLRPAEPRVRRPNPIDRKDYDEVVGRMFAVADTSRDGIATLAEFQTMIATRKDQAIQARFAAVDTDRNHAISAEEFAQWQRSLGSAVLTGDANDADAGGGAVQVAEIVIPESRSATGRAIARLVEPLGSTVITAANTDYDAGTSLAELIAYEGKRFEAADTNHDGRITVDEMPRGLAGDEPAAAAPAAPVAVRTGG